MDAEVEGEDEMHPSRRPRVAERVPFRVSPEVEPQNRDFDVNEFLRSSPNPVVASLQKRIGEPTNPASGLKMRSHSTAAQELSPCMRTGHHQRDTHKAERENEESRLPAFLVYLFSHSFGFTTCPWKEQDETEVRVRSSKEARNTLL